MISSKSVKFLYSYGGKILPRPSDGNLRYYGGSTRVLAVDRYVSFADEEVSFVIEEYERVLAETKIRAFLFPVEKVSQPSSPASCFDFPSVPKSGNKAPPPAAQYRNKTPVVGYPVAAWKRLCGDGKHLFNAAHRILSH